MEFSAGHRRYGEHTIVALTGDIDVHSSQRLRELLIELVGAGSRRLVVDLDQVTFLDSTGLGVFVGIFHRLRAGNGTLAIAGGAPRVREVFHVTQLTRIFPLHETVEDAVRPAGEGVLEP
ncbi:STAS domain-containing protein [Actinomadura macrotermitis]|uniref:Anti-sigma factor antagonist n=1 Tax=Actinomadura macrotermitis TaxID=2585200 RepID=A0A7K0BW31_9ACTN|nr:Anti-sigma-B factor antagonist [Actinomadura macrotermitis]